VCDKKWQIKDHMNVVCWVSSKFTDKKFYHSLATFRKHNGFEWHTYGVDLDTDINLIPNHQAYLLRHNISVTNDHQRTLISDMMRVCLIQRLLKRGYDKIIYLDADTEIHHSFELIDELLAKHDVVVTPHITEPFPLDGLKPDMPSLVHSGNFNMGFFACRHSTGTIKFLNYMHEITQALGNQQHFGAQGWLRFAPDLVENHYILKNAGYNTAYWNIKQRGLYRKDDKWYTKDGPLVVMHFSGLDGQIDPRKMSKHQTRYLLDGDDPLLELYKNYQRMVING
jgi:hypothetical protein